MKEAIHDYKSDNLKRLMQDFIESGYEEEFNNFVEQEYSEYLDIEQTDRSQR
jgi:uncharacterized membrane protein YebE (DUF533 family)